MRHEILVFLCNMLIRYKCSRFSRVGNTFGSLFITFGSATEIRTTGIPYRRKLGPGDLLKLVLTLVSLMLMFVSVHVVVLLDLQILDLYLGILVLQNCPRGAHHDLLDLGPLQSVDQYI